MQGGREGGQGGRKRGREGRTTQLLKRHPANANVFPVQHLLVKCRPEVGLEGGREGGREAGKV